MLASSVCACGQNMQCFTHPLCRTDEPMPLFAEPDVYLKDLFVLGEASYEVDALK